VSQTGDYTVTVTSTGGCTTSDTVTVTVKDAIIVNAGNDTSIVKGNSATLNATVPNGSSGSYQWTPDLNLSCSGCASTTASPDTTTTYTVTFLDQQECSAQ